MKMLNIIKKDLKEYYRESMTFKTVLLSPIIIIIIFGIIFSSGVPSTINMPMKISICSADEDLPDGFVDSLKEEKWVQLEEIKGYDNCDEIVNQSISAGKYKGGITIPEGFTSSVINGNRTYLRVYADNSLVGVEEMLKGYMWRVIQKYSDNFKDDPVASVKGEFSDLSERLNDLKRSISILEPMKSFEYNARDLNLNIQKINASSYISSVRETENQLQNSKIQIDGTYNEMTEFRNNIQTYITELRGVRSDLIEYDNKTLETKNSLKALYNLSCNTDVPVFPDVEEGCSELETSILELEQTHQELQDRMKRVDSLIIELQQADKDLEKKQGDLLVMKANVEKSQQTLQQASSSLSELEEMKNKSENFSEQIDSYSANASRQEREMKSELGTFSDNINEVLLGMNSLPLSPIEVEVRNTFDMSFLEFLIPSLITMLAMFTALFMSSTTIVTEKNSGTLTRNMLTPVTLPVFMIGKILSIIIVGLAELSVILLLGFFAFNIHVPYLLPQFIGCLMLSLFSFSVIGMFIGVWSDSGITAVLISITIMTVLLFISGITIPNELLPENVVQIAKLLPLSNAFSLVKNIFVYNTVDWSSALYLVIAGAIVAIVCVFSIVKKIR